MKDLSYTIANSFEELEDIRDIWDEFVVENGSSIYMSYDWCRIWWEHYGSGKKLNIFIFYYNMQLVAIVPMYIDSLRVGLLRLRAGKLVGSNIPPRIFDPPIYKRWSDSILESILVKLISSEKCDVVSFGPISVTYEQNAMLRNVCKNRSDIIGKFQERSLGVHSIFNLPETFKEYSNSLSKNERKNLRKYDLRYLKKRFDTKVDIINNCGNIDEEFKKFVSMHTIQWRNEGRPGHFKAWPKAEEFNLELVREFSRRGNLRLIRIFADNHVIDYQYTFAFGDSYYWLLPARVVGQEWERFSLGRTGLVNMIKLAIEEGIKKIEAGPGHYEYKVRLGAQEFPVIIFRVTANRFGSKLRSHIFYAMFFFVNVLYYKILYQRIQPRLPSFFHLPIWSFWTRLFL